MKREEWGFPLEGTHLYPQRSTGLQGLRPHPVGPCNIHRTVFKATSQTLLHCSTEWRPGKAVLLLNTVYHRFAYSENTRHDNMLNIALHGIKVELMCLLELHTTILSFLQPVQGSDDQHNKDACSSQSNECQQHLSSRSDEKLVDPA